MAFNVGILSGLGEASREHHSNLLTQEAKRREKLMDFWSKRMEDEDLTDEGREVVFRKGMAIAQTPYDKKLPKEAETLDDFLNVAPKMGQSWLGGQTTREVQATPMPIPSELPAPGQDRSIGSIAAGGVPDAERARPGARYQPEAADFTIPMPAPPTGVTRSPYLSRAEKEAAGERTYRKQQSIQTEETIKRERAQAAARKEFAVPSPDRSIQPFEVWREQNPTAPVSEWLKLEEASKAKAGTRSNYSKDTVTYKGSPTDVLVDVDPDSPTKGRVFLQTATGLQDITGQTSHYRPPPQMAASLQLFNATQPASGMPPDVNDALNRATQNLSPQRRMQVFDTVNQQFTRGNMNGARDTIKQSALDDPAVPTAVKQMVNAQRTVVNNLRDIQALLKDVPTNLVVGTIEDVHRRLGLTKDPKYVRLAQRLLSLNQSYRRAMTGAQFSLPESGEYARLFPSLTNTEPVNTAQIDSLIEGFSRDNKTFWDYKIGPGWEDQFGAPAIAAPGAGAGANAANREIVTYKGQRYYLVGTDAQGNAELEPVPAGVK